MNTLRIPTPIFIIFMAMMTVVSVHSSNAQQTSFTELTAVAWNPIPDSSLIAMGGATGPIDRSSASPILTIRNASDMSVVLDLSSIPNTHTIVVTALGWSPDGKYLVSGDSEGAIVVWNIGDTQRQLGEVLARLQDESTPYGLVSQAVWSPDGKWIATLTSGFAINIWNATNDDFHLVASQSILSGNDLAWSPDSAWIATNSDIGAEVYNISSTGQFVPDNQYTLTSDPGVYSRGVAWSPDGTQLAVSVTSQNRIDIYSINTVPQIVVKSITLPSPSGSIAWSPDGGYMAYVGDADTVHTIDINTGQELTISHTGKPGAAETISWHPSDNEIAFPRLSDTPEIVVIPITSSFTNELVPTTAPISGS